MKLSANFQLSELVKSQVAERKGIPNNPSPYLQVIDQQSFVLP
jgi:hypothetical protein